MCYIVDASSLDEDTHAGWLSRRMTTDHGTAATPMPSATPVARPSLQLPSLHASSDSITPLGPAALAARQLNKAEDQMERWSRALQQLRNRTDETVVRAPQHDPSLVGFTSQMKDCSQGYACVEQGLAAN